jgi:transcriptional regulator with XRE-family HTH domain
MRRPGSGRARSPRLQRDDVAAAIGARIARQRLARGWPQTQLGARAGLPVQRLSRLENGHSLPNVHELLRLREILELSLEELVVGKPTELPELRELVERLERLASPAQLRELRQQLGVWILRIESEKGAPA